MCDFYQQASDVIEQLILKKGSIKGLTYNKNINVKTSKTCYALVCETLKYKCVIDQIIENTAKLDLEYKKNKSMKYSLMIVMIYELLFSAHQSIKGGGHAKKTLLQYQTQINSALARLKIQKKCKENIDLLPDHIRYPITLPRYVRVNTLYNGENSIQQAIDQFKSEGYEMLEKQPELVKKIVKKEDGTLEEQSNIILGEKEFYQDADFKEILVFHHSIDLHDHKMLENGHIILQDKASCLPSFILSPPKGSVCIDSCSAPGNKTSLLSAQMSNTGKVYAIEKDQKRCGTLTKLTKRSLCKNIEAINDSFLNLKHDDPRFKDVEYILCDPSCSGSGIVNRLDYLLPTKYSGGDHIESIDENDEDLMDIFNQMESKNNNNNNNSNSNNKSTATGLNKKELKKEKKKQLKELNKHPNKKLKLNNNNSNNSNNNNNNNSNKSKEELEKDEKFEEEKRVKLLADFQLSIIQHAFAFPKVKRVIYSTCSVHQIENEDVVERAITELNKDGEKWRIVNILPHWNHSRGLPIYKNSEYSIRMTPSKDFTIGFFVALFEKIENSNGINNSSNTTSSSNTNSNINFNNNKSNDGNKSNSDSNKSNSDSNKSNINNKPSDNKSNNNNNNNNNKSNNNNNNNKSNNNNNNNKSNNNNNNNKSNNKNSNNKKRKIQDINK